MAKYCKYCGRQLPDRALFCNNCGKSLNESRPAFTESPGRGKSPAPKKETKKAKSPEKKKGIFSGINLLLTITLLIETAIAGFRYPGYFVTGEKPQLPPVISEPINNILGKEDGGGTTGTGTMADTLALTTVYTKAELDKAKPIKADVSMDHPVVQLGKYTVDFGEINLDHYNDTVVIKELPVKEDKGTGFTMTSFDISLESGQDQFIGEVLIELPSSADADDISYCMYYDEAEKRWRYLSSDLSEDGTTRTIYMHHFTEVTELKLEVGEIGANKALTVHDLLNTMYLYPEGYRQDNINMNLPVSVNYRALWKALFDGYSLDLNSVADAAGIDQTNLAGELPLPNLLAVVDTSNNTAALTDGIKTINDTVNKNGWLHKCLDSPFGRTTSNVMAIIGIYGAYMKTANEVVKGKTWWTAAMNNKLDIAAAGVSGAAAAYGSVAWAAGTKAAAAGPYVAAAAAVIGIGVFAYSKYLESTAGERDRVLEPTEQLYRDYYQRDKVSRTFYYDVKMTDEMYEANKGTIRYLLDLDDRENAILKSLINSAEPAKKFEEGLAGISPMQAGDRQKQLNMKWTRAVGSLYVFCADKEPERLNDLIYEFYQNYARSAYQDGFKYFNRFVDDDVKYRGYNKNMTDFVPDEETRNQIMNNMISELYENDLYVHQEMSLYLKHAMEEKLFDAIQYVLLPSLNAEIEFTVKDVGNSVYAADYRSLKANETFIQNSQYDKVISPLRFAIGTSDHYKLIKGPQFVPWEYYFFPGNGFHAVPASCYYPHTPNFLPKYNGKNDVVFTCTWYHWLMMGAPTVMLFQDVNTGAVMASEFEMPTQVTPGQKVRVQIEQPGISVDDYIGLWNDKTDLYIAISVNDKGKVMEYEGFELPRTGAAGWVTCDKYEIDQKTKTLILYSDEFPGPAKFTLLDEDTIRMPDQNNGGILTLYRVK